MTLAPFGPRMEKGGKKRGVGSVLPITNLRHFHIETFSHVCLWEKVSDGESGV